MLGKALDSVGKMKLILKSDGKLENHFKNARTRNLTPKFAGKGKFNFGERWVDTICPKIAKNYLKFARFV